MYDQDEWYEDYDDEDDYDDEWDEDEELCDEGTIISQRLDSADLGGILYGTFDYPGSLDDIPF